MNWAKSRVCLPEEYEAESSSEKQLRKYLFDREVADWRRDGGIGIIEAFYSTWTEIPYTTYLLKGAVDGMAEAKASAFENKEALKNAVECLFDCMRVRENGRALNNTAYILLLLGEKVQALQYLRRAAFVCDAPVELEDTKKLADFVREGSDVLENALATKVYDIAENFISSCNHIKKGRSVKKDTPWWKQMGEGVHYPVGSCENGKNADINCLNDDVLVEVFSWCIHDCLSSLATISLVCKRWRRVVCDEGLWGNIGCLLMGQDDFRCLQRQSSQMSSKDLVKNSFSNVLCMGAGENIRLQWGEFHSNVMASCKIYGIQCADMFCCFQDGSMSLLEATPSIAEQPYTEVRKWKGPSDFSPSDCAASLHSSHIAVSDTSGKLYVWDIEDESQKIVKIYDDDILSSVLGSRSCNNHYGTQKKNHVLFSPISSSPVSLVSCCNGSIMYWDKEGGLISRKQVLKENESTCNMHVSQNDFAYIVTAGNNKVLRVDTETGAVSNLINVSGYVTVVGGMDPSVMTRGNHSAVEHLTLIGAWSPALSGSDGKISILDHRCPTVAEYVRTGIPCEPTALATCKDFGICYGCRGGSVSIASYRNRTISWNSYALPHCDNYSSIDPREVSAIFCNRGLDGICAFTKDCKLVHFWKFG